MTQRRKQLRREIGSAVFRADQSQATLRGKLPEAKAILEKLSQALRAGTLPEAVAGLSPFESSIVVVAMHAAVWAAVKSELELAGGEAGPDALAVS